MSTNTPHPDRRQDDEIVRRVKQMKDEEIVDFIRDTVSRLDALADRLENLVNTREGDLNA